jgi:hypothetical protein
LSEGYKLSKQEMSVSQLVTNIEKGYIQKPEMQREYVWKATRVRDLLDSLYRGYPSGTILLWQTDTDAPTSEFAIATEKNTTTRPLLLLDGQQRLTSLSSVIRGEPINVREGRKLRQIEILFNLDHPDELVTLTEIDDAPGATFQTTEDDELDEEEEETLRDRFNQFTFIVSTPQLANASNWVNVSEVFASHSDAEFLKKAGVSSLDDPLFTKYSERLKNLRQIREYTYRLDVLEPALSYEEVTEIFIRVNSLGVKLRSSDLALAQITAKWRNSLVLFQEFQTEVYEQTGFYLDLGFFVKSLVISATGQSKFKTLGSLQKDELEAGWESAKKSITSSLNFLTSNLKIDSLALLSSPFIIHAISYWIEINNGKFSQEESSAMRRWALIANTKSYFSSSSESKLDADLLALRNGLGADGLLKRLEAQMGRLDVTETEISGKTTNSGYFKAMFIAFRQDGAKDWYSKLEISVKHRGVEDKLQFHHIFPKAFLRQNYPELRRNQVNDISNLAFIGGKTNREISAKPPAEYLKKIIDSKDVELLNLQAIPTEGEILDQYSYDDFLIKRRVAIVKRINRLLG